MKRMLQCMMVAVVFVFAVVAPASAQVTPQLNLSHVCTTFTERTDVHFVLVHSPATDYTTAAVTFTARFDGGAPFDAVAPFTRRTGDTAHFDADLPGMPAAVEVVTGTLTLDGVTYPLANPGIFMTQPCNAPTAVTLASMTAKPGGCYCNRSTGYYQCWRKTRWVKLWRCGNR